MDSDKLTMLYESGKANHFSLFDSKSPKEIIFIHSARTSFSDIEKTPFLYNILFGKDAPQIRLYRIEDKKLKLHFAGNMTGQESFEGTPLKISLSLSEGEYQTSLVIKDKKDAIIYEETSATSIQDPVEQLFGYLEAQIDIKIMELLEKIAGSKKQHLQVIRRISNDPILLNALLRFKPALYRLKGSFKSKVLVEEALCTGFGLTLETAEEIGKDTIYLFFKNHHKNIKKIISTHGKIEMIEKEINHIEVIGSSEIQLPPNMPPVSILITEEIDHQPYYKMSDASFPYLHPLFRDHIGLESYGNFELTQVRENVTAPNILIEAKAKKTPQMGKLEDKRLLGFGFISKTQKLDHTFIRLLADVEKHADTNFFNRMIFQPITDQETFDVSQELKSLVEKHLDHLQRLHIEKVFFNDKTKYIEISKILEGRLKVSETIIDSQHPVKQVSAANKVELRELQVLSRGEIWAYRIPNLIQSISNKIRKEASKKERAAFASGFIEYDLDHSTTVIHPTTGSIDYNFGELTPVLRPYGQNEAGVVLGLKTDDLGIGAPVKRLLIIGDLSHSSRGAIRGQECIRINAAIRYAAREKIPIDWYAASYGVQIHRERGVEGLDAAASTIREIVENCHHKGVQINFIINEANIGAQSYWDSMAAIVYDTTGILIMTPNGCMALTGPKSLACALYGTVPSEQIDTHTKSLYPHGLQSLSGHELVHGPNSDSMLFAKNLEEASHFLLMHHYYSYIKPNEKIATQRMIPVESTRENHEAVQKEIGNFLKGLKPNRELILEYLRDLNSPGPIKFWSDAKGIRKQTFENGDLPQEASTIVQEMLIGGNPTMTIFTPTGPLTPADADIIARAIYKASGRMQVLIIGSLSGFSCDPLSMKNRQLLEGALIAKAIVEHKGPILILNLGSLVGGTFVVFNKQLHPDLKIVAVEGARVQVIGGKSAAKVVFHSLILKQADQDARVLKSAIMHPESNSNEEIQKISKEKIEEIGKNHKAIRSKVIVEIENKEGVLFDQFHNAQRAMKVKSIDHIIAINSLRESVIFIFEELRTAYLRKTETSTDLLGNEYKLTA